MLPLNPVYLQGAEAVLAPYHLKKFQPPKMTFHVILSHLGVGEGGQYCCRTLYFVRLQNFQCYDLMALMIGIEIEIEFRW